MIRTLVKAAALFGVYYMYKQMRTRRSEREMFPRSEHARTDITAAARAAQPDHFSEPTV